MIELPGRTGTTAERAAKLAAFADALLRIDQGLDFRMGPRDWAYFLEEHGLRKDEFDKAERLINRCRDEGLLPVDFVLDDDTRRPLGDDPTECDGDINGYLEQIWSSVEAQTKFYDPVPWVAYQPYYVEVAVEKAGLKSLFATVAEETLTLVSNFRGDTDYLSRARMLLRFSAAVERGQTPVLCYCGDFDPKGVLIGEGLRNNLAKLIGTRFRDGTLVDFDIDILVIDHFGLSHDYILTELPQSVWTPNLITSGGRSLADPDHPDFAKYRVAEWLERVGERKCEANAIVVRPEAGRDLLRRTLGKYIDTDGIEQYRDAVAAGRAELAQRLPDYLTAWLREDTR
jgi:hypothetical protein